MRFQLKNRALTGRWITALLLCCLIAAGQRGSNIRTFTPSALLNKGQVEVKLFQNLYTQSSFFDPSGKKQELSERSTYFTSLNSFVFGVNSSRRFNVGYDVIVKSVLNADPGSSPLQVFRFASDGFKSRTAISSIGPTLKWQPVAKWKRVSLYSHFWIPTAGNLDGSEGTPEGGPEDGPFLEYQQFQWWNQLFFDRTIWNGDWQVFTSLEAWWRIGNDSKDHLLQLPIGAFLSWFPSNDLTVYGSTQYTPTPGSGSTYFIQSGVGGKWQFTSSWELEVSYTNFWSGNSSGAGQTFNMGFRFLR